MFAIRKPGILGAIALAFSLFSGSAAQADEELYQKVAASTVLVYKAGGPIGASAGTGFIVDAKERLLVTARHVVENGSGGMASTVEVVFPEYRDGEIITESKHYRVNRQKLAVRCKVVFDSARRDLAILQAEKLPAGVKALELAPKLAKPGQKVHLVGNSSEPFGAVFSYAQGHVRNAFHWDEMGARVVTTQIPANKGDSGGPMVNNLGQVVGYCAMSTSGENSPLGSTFHDFQVTELSICVSEIRDALAELSSPVVTRHDPTFKGEFKTGIHPVKMEKGVLYRINVTGEGFVPDVRVEGFLLSPVSTSVQGKTESALYLYIPKESKEYRVQVCPLPGRNIATGPRPYTLNIDRAAFAGEPAVQEAKLKLNEHTRKFEAGKAYNIQVKGKGFEPDVQILVGKQTVKTQLNNGLKAPGDGGFFEAIGLAKSEFETNVRFVAGKTADHRILVAVGPFSPPGAAARDYTIKITDLKVELSVKDELSDKDPRYGQAGPFKAHTVKLEAGKDYQFDLLTTAFDSKLVLEDAAGKAIVNGMDAEGYNARLFYRPTASGEYRVVVTSHQFDAVGEYSLSVMEGVPMPMGFPPFKGKKPGSK